jgi:coniferyl-aldehyde dehydrogenase
VHYQPLGVVGIMVPWNFPVMLSLGPLISALAAGNRAMIKLSEFTPHTNAVLRILLDEALGGDRWWSSRGCGDRGRLQRPPLRPSHLHRLHGGGSAGDGRGRPQLTPLTLELGGKSPCLIAPDMPWPGGGADDLRQEPNAGQICVAPDYVLLPHGREQALSRPIAILRPPLSPKGSTARITAPSSTAAN